MNGAHDDRWARLAHAIAPGSTLRRWWPLQGGVSAQVTGLELVDPAGAVSKLVVREHGARDRARNPDIAAHEFALLQYLCGAGLAVPRPIHLDRSGQMFAAPVLVVEYVEGAPPPANGIERIAQFATHLARIHTLDAATLQFLPERSALYTALLRQPPIDRSDAALVERIEPVRRSGRVRRATNRCCCKAISGPATRSGAMIGWWRYWIGRMLRAAIRWPIWRIAG